MLRLILSIISGLAIAFLLVFASDWLLHALMPSAASLPSDPTDRDAMAAYMAEQPVLMLAGLVFGWTVAAFLGSTIAARFADRGEWPGWVVGALFLLATAANFLMIPHPAWMVALAVAAILLATWLGARLGTRHSRRALA